MEREEELPVESAEDWALTVALEAVQVSNDRINRLRGFIRKESGQKDKAVRGVVVVDPLGVGLELVRLVDKQGFRLLLAFSLKWISQYAQNKIQNEINILSSFDKDESVEEEEGVIKLLNDIKKFVEQQGVGFVLEAVVTGSEAGVLTADKLSNRLGCKTNGETLSLARRNKALMQDVILAAGIRSIKQKLAYSSSEVCEFYSNLPNAKNGKKCVVKPNMSAANESVVLCSSEEEALGAWQLITGKRDLFGNVNDGVLCQEYLEGTEYVVDGVSRNGEYKVVAMWEYEKGKYNGGSFVYFGMKLVDPTSNVATSLVQYAESVAISLGIKYGPSHMEIMFDSSPCLIEAAPRCHNKKGTWLPIIRDCIGYSQIEAVIYSYLSQSHFDSLPKRAKIKSVPGLEVLKLLPSYKSSKLPGPGDAIKATVDAQTRVGTVQLVAESREQLNKDYKIIRDLEKQDKFLEVV